MPAAAGRRLTADTKLYLDDVARACDVARSTLSTYRSRGVPLHNPFPPPDGHDDDGHGHRRPWWYWATIAAWMSRRHGRGRRS